MAALIIDLQSTKYSFREKSSEWILSIGLIVWGIFLFADPNLFIHYKIYAPLLTIADQKVWAYITIFIGLFRLTTLAINGTCRPKAHLRVLGAVGGVTIWASLVVISILSIGQPTPPVSVYGMLLAFDIIALWGAAGEAKKIDVAVKTEKKLNVSNGK